VQSVHLGRGDNRPCACGALVFSVMVGQTDAVSAPGLQGPGLIDEQGSGDATKVKVSLRLS
jgi:hypothetical protein